LRTIEQAIHHALENIDSSNPTLREKLYRATWQAHEKMLSEAVQITEAEKLKRREELKNIIQSIEATFSRPMPPEMQSQEKALVKGVPSHPTTPAPAAPELASIRLEKRGVAPAEKKHSLLRSNGFLLVLIAILLFVAWSFYNRLIDYNNPPPADKEQAPESISSLITQDEDDFLPPTSPSAQGDEATPDRQWIRIFDPGDIESIRIKGGAQLQLHEEEGVRFLRLQTNKVEDNILIEIGSAVLTRARGKSLIFNIIARNPTQTTTRLSLACDISAVAACGRWRFELPAIQDDLLFGVDIPTNIQMGTNLTFTLSLDGDSDDMEYRVDIFGLEVSFDE